ncbi:PREDICTED: (3S,6E)-nerolidol synthase 1-like [Populus euphratica]|uniref:(3S,6E)-nerolidol synthase 1-like n=1 Tax=Populus euphratica TaxID=75702 RepID=A0AAJ6SVW3_POPEU|nr:PREDICTED: (3S,6E)-nerolidol synthase 1-like [Populus euphratica]XP_010999559.1 PREDICTED: (3S,6E)-nerolidol synthase 1-like [Populus euphratica]
MALSCSVSLTAASGWPCPQNRNSEKVKSILKEFKPTPPGTQKWSVSQKQTLAFSPTKQYPITINNDDSDTEYAEKLQTFKHILRKEGEEPIQGLAMIDAIQRLSIDYHFQEEIDSILTRQSMLLSTIHSDTNLYEVALRFRLLRQQGYHVSAGVFDNFKDNEGRFKQKLSCDIMGLVSLYEASQLSVRGEDVLDEAGDYSYQLLRSSLIHLDYNQARLVRNSFNHPHHKSLASFTAKYFFNDEPNGWIGELQELAKTEFKRVQSQHQHEIVEILKWWKDLGLSTELRFARDQPLKWYMWSVSCLTDPSLSEQRIELTKPLSMIYIIDDIFDVNGTLDELVCFTEVINRWDIAAAEQLPDYMKICFKALNNITNEISYKIYKEHGWNPFDSLRKAWASLCRAFLVEARWFASGKFPSGEEYLKNGIASSGVHVVLVHIFFLLGQNISKENVELISNFPPIISSTATILRLWDDLGSAKDENQDGHDGSYVECYLRENEGSSFEDARKQVLHMISDAWKQLNQQCLSPNSFSSTFSKASLNIARMVPLMYDYDDNHRLPSLEEHMKSFLHENVSVKKEKKRKKAHDSILWTWSDNL